MSQSFPKTTSSFHSFQQLRLPAERQNTCLSQTIFPRSVIDMFSTAGGVWGKNTLIHRQEKRELLQSFFWTATWQCLLKFEIHIPFDPAIQLLGIYPTEIKARVCRGNKRANIQRAHTRTM